MERKKELPAEESPVFWIRSELYNLNHEDKKILESADCWLNDKLMDAAQKLICKALGNMELYQSVLNMQKKEKPFHAVTNENLQLMYNGTNHWLLTFYSNGRIQICDSLYKGVIREIVRCMKALYSPSVDEEGKLNITVIPVKQQSDWYNCGVFAIAFAADLLSGMIPSESAFNVPQQLTKNHSRHGRNSMPPKCNI